MLIISQLQIGNDITVSFRKIIRDCCVKFRLQELREQYFLYDARVCLKCINCNYTMLESYFKRLCTSLVMPVGKIPLYVNFIRYFVLELWADP